MRVLLVVVIACLCSVVWSDPCTSRCDYESYVSATTDICGTDYENHKAPLTAIVGLPPPWACYRDCGVDVRYPGTCGCPNGCGEAFNRGTCQDNVCKCKPGWGGVDCNSVVCPNSCSNNGECVSVSKNLDVCICNGSFTGPDCSIVMNDLSRLPYGELFPGKYYQKDKYGDNHPVFNLSIIGNWRIEMDDKDYNAMLLPLNTYNQSHVDVKAYFSNGNINEKVHKVSMKLKGHFARLGVKKSFQIRFGDDFYHLKNLVFKAPALDPTYLHNLIIGEYLRAMMVPAARGSYATLTINGVFWGLYWMREELDQNFIHSRFGNDKGNFYSMSSYLRYIGDDQAAYKNITKDGLGGALPIYKEEFGNSNWSDLVAFAKFVNTSTDEEFANEVETWVDVEVFLRAMVVLSAINDADTYTVNGNNWNLYHNPENNLWEFVLKDFEETMINPFADALGSVATNPKALFAYRLMNIPKYVEIFNDYYSQFLQLIFDPSLPHSAKNRAEVLASFLEQIIEHDPFYHISYGLPISTTAWKLLVKEMEYFMELRNFILKNQIPSN